MKNIDQTRRRFMTMFGATSLGTTLVPGVLWARVQDAGTNKVTLEMVTDEDRDYMYRVYAQDSHARINLGIRRRLAPLLAFPAITVPAGFTPEGLPVGLEFLGRQFAEGTLLRLAYAFEQATHHRKPPSTTPALAGGGDPIPQLPTTCPLCK